MSSELQRDIERIDGLVGNKGLPGHAEAWQRLKPRLTPDREQLAMNMFCSVRKHRFDKRRYWVNAPERIQDEYLALADAAIAAMGEP